MAGGRPSKFTPFVREKILQALAVGASHTVAAHSAGVSYDVFRLWIKRGERQRHGPYRDFQEQVKEAEARHAVKLLAIVDKAAFDGSWSAAAWKLERKFPRDYGRPKEESRAETGLTEELVQRIEEARKRAIDYERSKGQPPVSGAS